MNCALPPLELSKKVTEPRLLVKNVALAAVELSKKATAELLFIVVMMALPALVEALNCSVPPVLLVMLAFAALDVSVPPKPAGMPNRIAPLLLLVIVALPALLLSKKASPAGNPTELDALLVTIVALPAVLLL